jgi:hypothetical protein
MKTIEIKWPVCLINLENPEEVSYEYKEGPYWRQIVVGTYAFGLPELKEGDILYKYTENRGYVYNKENEIKKKLMNTDDIFLISKGWIDPIENHNASGYKPYSYTKSEDEAKTFCESQGYWTDKDCWEIGFMDNKQMPKYIYKKISKLSNNQEIIDSAYEVYLETWRKSIPGDNTFKESWYKSSEREATNFTKEEFTEKIKTDIEFANVWIYKNTK